MFFYKLLGKLVLNKEMLDLGDTLANADVRGAEVVGRGTIMVDGKVIASSDEFKKLKASAQQIVRARTNNSNHGEATTV
ncbi:MAG: hypothetical protein ACRDAR_21730 [Aeromonas veronii]